MLPHYLDLSVKDCLDSHPQTLPVFQSLGFHDFDNQQVREKLGPFLKVRTLLKFKNIDPQNFLNRCQAAAPPVTERTASSTPEEIRAAQPTLLALLPCGLKVSLNNALQTFAEQLASQGTPLAYLAEGNVNHELSYYPYIDAVDSVDELPDLILSSDINAFYHHRFLSHFIEPGHFASVNGRMAPYMEEIGFADPHGHFTMFCANTLVLVRVKDVRPELATPSSWAELLEPRYRKSIIMRGQDDFFCSGVLVPFYRLYGEQAILQLAGNVYDGMHPSKMVKMIESHDPNTTPFYLMPWFFAHKIKTQERIDIVFPEEGAFISPVQLLVKKERREKLTPVIDFLMSRSLHQHCTNNYFPSPHPEVQPNLPADKRLFWIGWDFIYNQDIEWVKREMGNAFTKEYRRTGSGTCS